MLTRVLAAVLIGLTIMTLWPAPPAEATYWGSNGCWAGNPTTLVPGWSSWTCTGPGGVIPSCTPDPTSCFIAQSQGSSLSCVPSTGAQPCLVPPDLNPIILAQLTVAEKIAIGIFQIDFEIVCANFMRYMAPAVITSPVGPQMMALMYIACALTINGLKALVDDPPDANFTVYPPFAPQPFTPLDPAAMAGFMDPAATQAANTFLTLQREQAAYLEQATASLDKASGALLACDQTWVRNQAAFADQAIAAAGALGPQMLAAQAGIVVNGAASIPDPDFQTFMDDWRANTNPTLEYSVLGGTPVQDVMIPALAQCATTPTLTANPVQAAPADRVTMNWGGIPAPSGTDWIGLYPPGAADSAWRDWLYLSTCTKTPGTTAHAHGQCPFPLPNPLTPGTYEFRLFSNNTYSRLASSGQIGVMLNATAPVNRVSAVSWQGIPAPTPTDWLGLYQTDRPDTEFLAWEYVSGTTTPTVARASGSVSFALPTAPLPTGSYEVRLLSNNGFTRLAVSGPFAVTTSGAALSASPVTVVSSGTVRATWSGLPTPLPMDWIGVYALGAPDAAFLAWAYVSCTHTATTGEAAGTCAIDLPALDSGFYELRLYANNGYTRRATSARFFVPQLLQ